MIQKHRKLVPHIHPTAWVHPAAVVIGEVELGPYVTVWPGAILRGDCGAIRVGAYTNIQDGALVHTTFDVSQTILGERITVGHGAVLHGCIVGDDCLVGMHSTLLDNCRIGHHSIVGAGAVVGVGKQFEPMSLIMGNPAQRIRACNDKNLAQIDYGWNAYKGYREPFVNGEVEDLPDDWHYWPQEDAK
ncbi:MAG: gamma carbonic anhydrase family protein [Deltaproteobacteria bacterium]|nr:gamma carbonic anhydrase family protein [Deltaproteobacteria bacterium]